MNRIVLVGRLENTPEIRYTSSGIPVSNFSLSVRRSHPNSEGIWERDVFRIVTWRKLAETCCKHLERGRWIAVDGKLQNRFITTQNNERRVMVEIHADDIRFLDFRQQHRDRDASETRQDRNPKARLEEQKFQQDTRMETNNDRDVEERKDDGNGAEVEREKKLEVESKEERSKSYKPYLEDEEGTPLDMSDV